MRLIDADAYLKKICKYEADGCGSCKFQTVCPVDMPTVKAVPVEWIKEYMFRLPDGSEAYECILVMLEEWKRAFDIEEDPDELLEKLSDILSVFPKLQGLIMDVLEEKKND